MNHTSHDVSLTVSKIIKPIPGCVVASRWFDVKRHASISIETLSASKLIAT